MIASNLVRFFQNRKKRGKAKTYKWTLKEVETNWASPCSFLYVIHTSMTLRITR
jgi:hypothetical protein